GDGIRDLTVTGVQTCALPIWATSGLSRARRCSNTAAAEESSSSGFTALFADWFRRWVASAHEREHVARRENLRVRPCLALSVEEIGRASWRERVEVWLGPVAA